MQNNEKRSVQTNVLMVSTTVGRVLRQSLSLDSRPLSLGRMCVSSRFASHRSHLVPISSYIFFNFICEVHHKK